MKKRADKVKHLEGLHSGELLPFLNINVSEINTLAYFGIAAIVKGYKLYDHDTSGQIYKTFLQL
jgi:hypothetical protein